MSELFIPRNPIETAKEFQWEISMAHPEEAQELAAQANMILGDVREIHGSKRLIVHALAGYSVNRQLPVDEEMIHYEMDEVVVRGYFGGLPYISSFGEPKLQTFMVDMRDVEVLEPKYEDKLSRFPKVPILFPVLDVESVMVAA